MINKSPKYIDKRTLITKNIELNKYSLNNGKTIQNESQFGGVFIEENEIKKMWLFVFLGPLGFVKPFLLSFKKNNGFYVYCDISRAKVERIALAAIIFSLFYAFIIYYYIQDVSAKELDRKYKEEQIQIKS